jgi:hypothetical protein
LEKGRGGKKEGFKKGRWVGGKSDFSEMPLKRIYTVFRNLPAPRKKPFFATSLTLLKKSL